MRWYHKHHYYVCDFSSGQCGDEDQLPPNCLDCEYYKDWKKSGLTIKDFSEKRYCRTCNVLITDENRAEGAPFGISACKSCMGE